jgi:pseudouridine-5'-phosphate glycosidase
VNDWLTIAPEITQALDENGPIVALESALVTHGFSPPSNLDIARRIQSAVREERVMPATIAVLDGRPKVGLSDEELERLAADGTAHKVSLRDLPLMDVRGTNGGTTVAATMLLAHRAGIPIFATGGIGGVHRDHPEDVSADLLALASIPVVVVCAGAKAILDLHRTREVLETHGVPVIGYTTSEFPAFYSRRSGLGVDVQVDTPEEVAHIARTRSEMSLSTGLLVCVPVPEADEIPASEIESAIAEAVAEADAAGVSGKAVTPFLLGKVVELTGGRARQANQALLLNNARVAAHIARAMRDSIPGSR